MLTSIQYVNCKVLDIVLCFHFTRKYGMLKIGFQNSKPFTPFHLKHGVDINLWRR